MKKKLHLILLVLILLACSYSLFRPLFFRIHDYSQGARIAEMALALKDGHFPVRWSKNFGFGLGMPLFNFYAPLPYYVTGFLNLLGLDLLNCLRLLFFIPNLVTLIGAYLLGKKIFNSSIGIVVSASITLAPYRAVDLFVRGAISELWALMFLPLLRRMRHKYNVKS